MVHTKNKFRDFKLGIYEIDKVIMEFYKAASKGYTALYPDIPEWKENF